jgi:nucleotide-binding universal stress UspA family protein
VHWILGLDTRHHSLGAIRFAAWLHEKLDDPDFHISAVHVLEHDEAMVLLRRMQLDDLLSRRRAWVAEAIAAAGADQAVQDVQVVQDTTAEEHLAHALQAVRATGLIIGRSAPRDASALVRLGRVARRLARSLPGPVVIVPPDLEPTQLGDGPVLCAAAPTLESLDAVRAAIDIAGKLGRPVQLVHGVRLPDPLAQGREPGLHDTLAADILAAAARRLEKWCEAYGVAGPERDVVAGDPAAVIGRRAAELGAPLVVCGSRRLDLIRRAFTSSLGTHLASYSRVPVMIVPPR